MLTIKQLGKSYQVNKIKVEVLRNFNLSVSEGEIWSIFGPNGCGKTTLLELIAGITDQDEGTIEYKDRKLDKYEIGAVFQDYRASLMPWLTVRDNIAFPLKLKGIDQRSRNRIVEELCNQYGLHFQLDVFPYQLSGGQQQFTALLRALIIKPKLLLMDEPFTSLDYETTLSMLTKVAALLHQLEITTIFVSHDIDTSIFLAQHISLVSNKPTKVIKEFDNRLPYPRTLEMMTKESFIKLKEDILKTYYEEIQSFPSGF